MATGDKKPIVMGEAIGTEGGPAPNTHAARHAANGADPITPDMIGAASNPNLLDNWYFADPIDQRGGYVIKLGSNYLVPGESTAAGTTDTYYKVDSWAGAVGASNAYFYKDGTKYVTAAANAVRGYLGNWQYTIDRWKASGHPSQITDNGIILTAQGTQFLQPLDTALANALEGQTVTISILDGDNGLHYKTYTYTTAFEGFVVDSNFYVQSGLVGGTQSILIGTQSGAETILAAKLELGDKQTLAHLENGVWVLNEIPNYAEELAKCQRTAINTEAESRFAATTFVSGTAGSMFIPTPVTMRANPALTLTGEAFVMTPTGGNRVKISSLTGAFVKSTGVAVNFNLDSALDGNLACVVYIGGNLFLSSDL